MVEPNKFTELYEDTKDVTNNYSQLKIACDHTFYLHRYHLDKVKKLSKYVEILTKAKESIQADLDSIQSAFDNLETNIIIYLHNHKRTQEELLHLAEQNETQQELSEQKANEREEALKKYCMEENERVFNEEECKPIINIDNAKEFKEEMDKIVDYIEKF
jgi:hypothetical protein